MKLDTETRTKLYKAHRKKKALEIAWPSSQQPIAGHTYKLDGSDETRIRVEKFYRNGWKALVRLDHDPILSIRLPGIRNEQGDYETEPEPVSNAYQKLLDSAGGQATVLQGAERRREERKLRNADRGSRVNAPKWLQRLT